MSRRPCTLEQRRKALKLGLDPFEFAKHDIQKADLRIKLELFRLREEQEKQMVELETEQNYENDNIVYFPIKFKRTKFPNENRCSFPLDASPSRKLLRHFNPKDRSRIFHWFCKGGDSPIEIFNSTLFYVRTWYPDYYQTFNTILIEHLEEVAEFIQYVMLPREKRKVFAVLNPIDEKPSLDERLEKRRSTPATQKQINYLHYLGYHDEVSSLYEAQQLIGHLLKKKQQTLV